VIAVVFVEFVNDDLTGHHGRLVLLGFRSECLTSLRGIDTLQSNLVLDVINVKGNDGIAIRDVDDFACQYFCLSYALDQSQHQGDSETQFSCPCEKIISTCPAGRIWGVPPA